MFKDSTVGKCPVPPAQLALAIILQAYTGVSDDEVIEARSHGQTMAVSPRAASIVNKRPLAKGRW